MSDKLIRSYFAIVAIASVATVLLVPYSRWADVIILVAVLAAAWAPLFYWHVNNKIELLPWMASAAMSVCFGIESFLHWLHYSRHRYPGMPHFFYGALTIVFLALLLLVLAGPAWFRRAPKRRHAFSLLGKTDVSRF